MSLSIDNRSATVLCCVSKAEADLCDLIDTIRFGAVLNMEMPLNPTTVYRQVSDRRKALLDFLRETPFVDELVIHDGEVTYANINGTVPFQHVRKVKF